MVLAKVSRFLMKSSLGMSDLGLMYHHSSGGEAIIKINVSRVNNRSSYIGVRIWRGIEVVALHRAVISLRIRATKGSLTLSGLRLSILGERLSEDRPFGVPRHRAFSLPVRRRARPILISPRSAMAR